MSEQVAIVVKIDAQRGIVVCGNTQRICNLGWCPIHLTHTAAALRPLCWTNGRSGSLF